MNESGSSRSLKRFIIIRMQQGKVDNDEEDAEMAT
jgi:hypothetical protein